MAKQPSVDALIEQAKKWLGTPYSWGGGNTSGPTRGIAQGSGTVGFDCSSFVQYLYAQQGISLGRQTYDQVNNGDPVDKGSLRPGDILFFHSSSRGPEHEGLYLGGGKFIEAPHTGASIRISNLADRGDYVSARRVIPAGAPAIGDVAQAAAPPTPAKQKAAAATGTPPPAAAAAAAPTAVMPPASAPPPGLELPGSVPFTLDHRQVASTWQSIAEQFPSPETQQFAYLSGLGQ